MSQPADPADLFRAGYKEGLIAGCLIGLFCCAFMCAIYYHRTSQPSHIPDLSTLVGDIRRAKSECEDMVRTVKQRWHSRLITDSDSVICSARYRDLSACFNGVSASLEAMLSTGYDDTSVEALRANLAEAHQKYRAFHGWFTSLSTASATKPSAKQARQPGPILYGELPDVIGPFVDLTKHFLDGLKEVNREKRLHLIEMLRECRFKTWWEIPDGIQPAPATPIGQALPSN